MVRGSKKGYINKFLFAEYGKQLIYHLHAAGQLDKLNLILMDSHYSHVFNYCYMKMMFDKDIKVMALDKNPFIQLLQNGIQQPDEEVQQNFRGKGNHQS